MRAGGSGIRAVFMSYETSPEGEWPCIYVLSTFLLQPAGKLDVYTASIEGARGAGRILLDWPSCTGVVSQGRHRGSRAVAVWRRLIIPPLGTVAVAELLDPRDVGPKRQDRQMTAHFI